MIKRTFLMIFLLAVGHTMHAQVPVSDSAEAFIRAYPTIEQIRMKDEWLSKGNQLGDWSFTVPDPNDNTVVTPQPDVVYGYSWFNLSDGPAVVYPPEYDKYYSLAFFDMDHFIPDVVVAPDKPIVLRTVAQKSPLPDAHEVVLRTETGLAMLRMVVIADKAATLKIASKTRTEGGNGKSVHLAPGFSESARIEGLKRIEAMVPHVIGQVDNTFTNGYRGNNPLLLAAGVMLGQLGLPVDSVNYRVLLTDDSGQPLDGSQTYTVDVPDGMHTEAGYWTLTVYETATKMLIANDLERYSMIVYKAEADTDGNYTVTFSPDGDGKNAIPTVGKSFYAVLRVYDPTGKTPQLTVNRQ